MNWLERLIEQIDDRLNPIAVKELRQAVQSKFVAIVLMLFLFAQLCFFVILVAGGSRQDVFELGKEVFQVLLFILMLTCIFFVPAYSTSRLLLERSDNEIDFFFITALRPSTIILGKFWSSFILTILIFSTCMPFMTLTYLLRGIDFLSIFFLLTFCLLLVVPVIQLAILIGCLPIVRQLKSALGLIGVFIGFGVFPVVLEVSNEILRYGLASQMASKSFWAVVATVLVFIALGIGFLFILAIATVTPSSANRAFPIRVYMAMMWLVILAVTATWSFFENTYFPLIFWLAVSGVLAGMTIMTAICEREELGIRITRTIPATTVSRLAAFIFYSGAASGVAFFLFIVFLTALVVGAIATIVEGGSIPSFRDYHDWEDGLCIVGSMVFYCFAYAMCALLVRKKIFPKRIKPMYTWAILIVLVAIGSLGPVLICLFFFSPSELRNSNVPHILNPFAVIDGRQKYEYFSFSFCWSGIMILAIRSWLWQCLKKFKRYEN